MTRGFGGIFHPRHVRTIHNPRQSEDKKSHNQGQQSHSQSTRTHQNSFRPPAQEAEEDIASEEDKTLNQEDYSAYYVERIRDTQQGLAKSQYKSRRK
jgi:RecB family exonuclease